MNKWMMVLSSVMTLGFASAYADTTVDLNNVNTNNCERLRKEVLLLSTTDHVISSVCSDYAEKGYKATDGNYYDYRIYTNVVIRDDQARGVPFEMNYINTDNCVEAQRMIMLFDSPAVTVDAVCSEKTDKGFKSSNGKAYDYRLYTNLIFN